MNQMLRFLLAFSMLSLALSGFSQLAYAPPEKEVSKANGVWLGLYTKYRFNDRWGYYGEYHVRMKEGMHKMAQVYLRFGATYKVSKYLDFTAGFVNPYYWAPNPEAENMDRVVPQYRLWQQGVLVTPFEHVKVMHQLRMEQRWRRDYQKSSPFELTYRFRYKLTAYIPLNHRDFSVHTLFLAFYEEIFMQAGRSIVYNHFEDNRAYAGLGYNLSPSLQVHAGYMNSYRHRGEPFKYESRDIIRFSIIHHLEKEPKALNIPVN